MSAAFRETLAAALAMLLASPAVATVEMQVQAKKLGFAVGNCLYCHAHSHSVAVMKQKAKAFNLSDGNCLGCHGANIPSKLNDRGRWLVAEKTKRGVKACDMAWLHDYKEPTPAPAASSHQTP